MNYKFAIDGAAEACGDFPPRMRRELIMVISALISGISIKATYLGVPKTIMPMGSTNGGGCSWDDQ